MAAVSPPSCGLDPDVEDALLAIDFGTGGQVPDEEVCSLSSDESEERQPISRQGLATQWFRAMRRASAYHAAYRAAVAALAARAREYDALKDRYARLQDQYDALRARTMMEAW